jgi:hypothetical protein
MSGSRKKNRGPALLKRGPIARKVIATLGKERRRRTIDFSALKLGAEKAEELERGVISETEMREYDPLHAVYIYAQNTMSVLVEQITELPMCAALTDAYAAAEEEYMPSGPPMSPLTGSYFFCWGVFDSAVGQQKETLGTVAIDLCRAIGTEPSLVRLFEHMQASRMGLYVHEGVDGPHVMLREFVTGTLHRCISPAGYLGQPGEMWFVRVLPEPFESLHMGYSLVFNTPYVIGRYNGHFKPANPAEWQAFLDRAIPETGIANNGEAYSHLLKYGLSRTYWNDYLMDAYVNHRPDVIMLAGIPDVPASLPQSRENEPRSRRKGA